MVKTFAMAISSMPVYLCGLGTPPKSLTVQECVIVGSSYKIVKIPTVTEMSYMNLTARQEYQDTRPSYDFSATRPIEFALTKPSVINLAECYIRFSTESKNEFVKYT